MRINRWISVFVTSLMCCFIPAIGCSTEGVLRCEDGVSLEDIDPDKRPCQQDCECSNLLYTGRCVLSKGARLCQSAQRATCSNKGATRECVVVGAIGECAKGQQTCGATPLTSLHWGDCKGPEAKSEGTKCNGKDDNCDGRVDDGLSNCCPEIGAQKDCYTGRFFFNGRGICKGGKQLCTEEYVWSKVCEGEVLPKKQESCDNTDEDCNGKIDDNLRRACQKKAGICEPGYQLCNAGTWSDTCYEQRPIEEERCDGADNDCDGQVDEQAKDMPLSETCTYPLPNKVGVGVCQAGVKVCKEGTWSRCQGEVLPAVLDLCGDNKDNDCDGEIDEGCAACVPLRLSGRLLQHTDEVTGLFFHASGDTFVSLSRDKTMRFWSFKSKQWSQEHMFTMPLEPTSLSFRSGSDELVVAQGTKAERWDLSQATPTKTSVVWEHGARIRHVLYSPTGLQLVTVGDDRVIRLWDLKKGSSISLKHRGSRDIETISYGPDGRFLLVGDGSSVVYVWNAVLGSFEQSFGFSSKVSMFALGRDRRSVGEPLLMGLATARSNVEVWDLLRTQYLRETAVQVPAIGALAFNYDNTLLAAGDTQGDIKLWSPKGTPVVLRNTLRASGLGVSVLAFRPGRDNTLMSVSRGKEIRIWSCPPANP
ncbi:MAG: hypothetical protein CL920_09520 [Deltaproteobacteria bacterium]|nr:hypothetical protein [Deltaproteobacteria bacterium]